MSYGNFYGGGGRFGGGGASGDFELNLRMQVEGARDCASGKSNLAHDMQEGFMADMKSMGGLLGGLLGAPMQMKSGKKGG